MVNKAMIMSAGVGSRLDPLTRYLPKPLVPIVNIPTMDILLKHLIKNGINKFIANTYYLAEQIHERYTNNNDFDMHFEYIHEQKLSGTAGGVKKCQYFFNEGEDFLVMSADGFMDIDIKSAIKSHKDSNCIATMITKEVPYSEVSKFGVVVTGENGLIQEFQEKPKQKEAKSNLVNTGVYIFKYDIFEHIPSDIVYDFGKNVFPDLISKNISINTYTTKKYWSDIGSIKQYITSTNDIFEGKVNVEGVEIIKTDNGALIKGVNCQIDETIQIIGNCTIGNNCMIGKNSKIIDSIIWDDVQIEENIEINNCIIANSSKIFSPISNEVIEANSIVIKKNILKNKGHNNDYSNGAKSH